MFPTKGDLTMKMKHGPQKFKRIRVLYPFDKPIKSLYFLSFVVFVLFARFHFKVIRKSFHCFGSFDLLLF